MDPVFAFLIEHWLLSSAFVVIAILIAINEWRHRAFGVPGVDPIQLVDLLNHKQAVIIDIRAQPQFEQGHILGAISLPQVELIKGVNVLNKYKSKPMIVVCAAGMDSPKIIKTLKDGGFSQLYYLTGGIESWRSQNLPIVTKK